MINPQELRIGNWVGHPSGEFRVTDIADGNLNLAYSEGGGHSWLYNCDDCFGIDLNPELLKQCGLIRGADNEYFIGRFNFRPKEDKCEIYVLGNDTKFHWLIDIHFLHELQNFTSLLSVPLTINF